MPWNDQSNGSGQKPPGGPWGEGPKNPWGGPPRQPTPPPSNNGGDLEDMVKRLQDRMKGGPFGGRRGGRGDGDGRGPGAGGLAVRGALLVAGWFASAVYIVDEGEQGVRAALTFKDGIPAGFKFNTDKMSMKFGEFVTVTGQDILINTEAKGSEYIVSIGSVGAEIKAGPLKIGGKMKKFGITGAGRFVTQPGFGVELSMDEASPDSFKWPRWLPIRLTSLGIEWKDIQKDPADFALVMDAKVSKIPGIPLDFTGSVSGLRVDVGLLKQGKFPVTDLESISVKVGGDFGGGEVSGTLLGGIAWRRFRWDGEAGS